MAGLVKYKGIKKEIGGVEYIIPPISLGTLEQMQERITQVTDSTDASSVSTVIDATHASLKRNYPDITREHVADIIDVENMMDIYEAVMDVSGLKRKALETAGVSGE